MGGVSMEDISKMVSKAVKEATDDLKKEFNETNSLGLNQIENLQGIMKTQLNEAESCSSVEQLTAMTKSTWASILLSVLRSLASGL